MKIRIMLLIGSNGKASTCVEGDLGWGDLADNIMTWDGKVHMDPEATSRHIVTVEVPEPTVGELAGEVREV